MNTTNTENLIKPVIAVSEEHLEASGYTVSGKKKFRETIQDFSNQVFTKAVLYGDTEKGVDLEREVTHEHVTTASSNIVRTFGKKETSKWLIVCQVAEYVFTGIGGVGGGNLDEQWGIITFVVGLLLAAILIVVRLTNSSKD